MDKRVRLIHNIFSKLLIFLVSFGAVAAVCMHKYNVELAVDDYGRYHSYAVGELGTMEVHFIDVGQGDCTLIECQGEAMLIDAGDNSKGSAVWKYLTEQHIDSLKYVVGTHPDADHIGGMDVVITKFQCETVMLPDYQSDTATYRDVIDAAEYKNYDIVHPASGDTYSLGTARITVIAPNRVYEDSNNSSIGLIVAHGDNVYIFTGDCEQEAEQDILNNGIDINADVYKVAHHGSYNASTEDFLKAVSPAYAVISCGEGNSYGHPHEETLERLEAVGCVIYRTDLQGTIVSVSDGQNILWNVK